MAVRESAGNEIFDDFKSAAAQFNTINQLETGLTADADIFQSSTVLRLYKSSWSNLWDNPLHSPSRIFCAIWWDPHKPERLCYNIHALKLRDLKGYRIESRKFASAFRKAFNGMASGWPNVSTNLGPLNLMEGWELLKAGEIREHVLIIAQRFLTLAPIIDETLLQYKIKL